MCNAWDKANFDRYIKNQMIVKEIMFNLYSTLVIINFISFPIFIIERKITSNEKLV